MVGSDCKIREKSENCYSHNSQPSPLSRHSHSVTESSESPSSEKAKVYGKKSEGGNEILAELKIDPGQTRELRAGQLASNCISAGRSLRAIDANSISGSAPSAANYQQQKQLRKNELRSLDNGELSPRLHVERVV